MNFTEPFEENKQSFFDDFDLSVILEKDLAFFENLVSEAHFIVRETLSKNLTREAIESIISDSIENDFFAKFSQQEAKELVRRYTSEEDTEGGFADESACDEGNYGYTGSCEEDEFQGYALEEC